MTNGARNLQIGGSLSSPQNPKAPLKKAGLVAVGVIGFLSLLPLQRAHAQDTYYVGSNVRSGVELDLDALDSPYTSQTPAPAPSFGSIFEGPRLLMPFSDVMPGEPVVLTAPGEVRVKLKSPALAKKSPAKAPIAEKAVAKKAAPKKEPPKEAVPEKEMAKAPPPPPPMPEAAIPEPPKAEKDLKTPQAPSEAPAQAPAVPEMAEAPPPPPPPVETPAEMAEAPPPPPPVETPAEMAEAPPAPPPVEAPAEVVAPPPQAPAASDAPPPVPDIPEMAEAPPPPADISVAESAVEESAATPVPLAPPPMPPAMAETQTTQTAALPPDGGIDAEGQNNIIFDSGSAVLDEQGIARAKAIRALLEADQTLRLQLVAYASGGGDNPSRARRLSLSRALAVRSFLVDQGVKSTRMDVRALGNKFEEGPGDRVDLIILNQ